jgi:hypothetical protein
VTQLRPGLRLGVAAEVAVRCERGRGVTESADEAAGTAIIDIARGVFLLAIAVGIVGFAQGFARTYRD